MKGISRYIRLYRIFVVQYIKTILQSKMDFFVGLSGFLISQVTGLAFLYLIFEQIPSMQEWTLEQMLFIYGFSQIPRGIDHLLTDNLWMVGWQMVIKGTFDKYILRPMNIFFQIVCEKVQFDALGELLIGGIFVGRAVIKGVIEVTVLKVLFFGISVIAGAVIYTSVKLLFAAMAFWFKDSSPLMTASYEIADFAKYPVQIYSKPIDIILNTKKPGDVSGLDFAREIRGISKYKFTPLVFITSLEDPKLYSYSQLHCYGYIEKPFSVAQVKDIILGALEFPVKEDDDRYVYFRKDGIVYSVYIKEIIYIESSRRKITIHCVNDELEIPYRTCGEILQELDSKSFVQCSRYCIVNKKYIKQIDYTNRFIKLRNVDAPIEIGIIVKKSFKQSVENG